MTPLPRARLVTASAVIVLIGLNGEAMAQDAAAPAESLFEEGRRLLAENRFAEACEKLTASERLDPAVGTLLNLGDCWEKMGKIASAWAVFKDAAAMASRANQASREKTARTRAAALEPKIPRLTIVVTSPTDGIEVRRDGVVVGPAEWSATSPSAIAIDPGDHAIVASAPGKKAWTTKVTLAADGQTTRVEVAPLEVDELADRAPLQPAKSAGSSVEAVDAHDRNVQHGLGIALGSVGVVAMIVAAPLGARAITLNKDARGECPTNSTCTSQGQTDAQSAVTLGTGSTVFLSAGAAVVVGGIALYLTAPEAKHAKTARGWTPLLGPGSVGLAGSF